mmetsp:Transcript_3233/g.12804  ORF Transcript_3233/g.12804 Transcript_3233/m.12804 type:complete len:355 (-) Transcript_3233:2302-3366(-)
MERVSQAHPARFPAPSHRRLGPRAASRQSRLRQLPAGLSLHRRRHARGAQRRGPGRGRDGEARAVPPSGQHQVLAGEPPGRHGAGLAPAAQSRPGAARRRLSQAQRPDALQHRMADDVAHSQRSGRVQPTRRRPRVRQQRARRGRETKRREISPRREADRRVSALAPAVQRLRGSSRDVQDQGRADGGRARLGDVPAAQEAAHRDGRGAGAGAGAGGGDGGNGGDGRWPGWRDDAGAGVQEEEEGVVATAAEDEEEGRRRYLLRGSRRERRGVGERRGAEEPRGCHRAGELGLFAPPRRLLKAAQVAGASAASRAHRLRREQRLARVGPNRRVHHRRGSRRGSNPRPRVLPARV